MKKYAFLNTCFLILILPTILFGQQNDKVEVLPNLTKETVLTKCKKIEIGESIFAEKPIYPEVAKAGRIGGSVKVEILIDEKGNVLDVINIFGKKALQKAAIEAALKSKFSPTICDGKLARVNALMIYNFIPFVITDNYFKPESIEDYTDVSNKSEYYESILFLTENYDLTFGYGDKKFHSDAPLTKGDFVHFLRLTLDLLHQRATLANKNPKKIELYKSFNPQNIKSTDEVIDFNSNFPYSNSLSYLVSKYRIGLVDKKNEVKGKFPLTQNEVIDYWTKIFGKDAVPVHFRKIISGDKIFTRGEFSLFLQESMYVLTYKVLP